MAAYGNALQSTTTDVDELIKLTGSLSLEQTKNVLASKNLNSETVKNVLSSRNLTVAETTATAATIAKTGATATATSVVGAYTAALLANAKAMVAATITNPVAWIAGIAVAIGFAVHKYNEWNVTLEEHKEKLSALQDEYSELQDELKTLTDEIKANDEAISKLQEKFNNGTISLVEEDQLRKLNRENSLLQEQYEVREKLAQQKNEELANENRTTFNAEYIGSVDDYARVNHNIKDSYGEKMKDYTNATDKDLVMLVKANDELLTDAIQSGNRKVYESLMSDKDLLAKKLEERYATILDSLLVYQNNLSLATNEDDTFINPLDEQAYNDIESWKKWIYKGISSSGDWNTVQIETVIDENSLQETQNLLIERLNSGTLTEQDLAGYVELNMALFKANLLLKEGQLPASVYYQYLKQIAKTQNEVNATTPEFSFNDTNAPTIDAYQSQLASLDEASKKLQNGSFTATDLVDLLQEFPELTDKTNNLSYAIQDLANDKLNVLKDELKSMGASDEILALFDEYAAQVQNFSLDNILSELNNSHTALKDLEDEVDETGVISVGTLQNIASNYPKLNELLDDYLKDKKNESDIIDALKEEYQVDLDNYKTYMLQKNGLDTEFYDDIVDNLSDDLISKAEYYGIELGYYKNYNEAKLAMDKEYLLKKEKLEGLKNATSKVAPSLEDKGLETDKPFSVKDTLALSLFGGLAEAEEELSGYEKFLEEFDTEIKVDIPDFKTDLFTGGTGDTEEFSDSIDWAANSISNLEAEISRLNETISNTTDIDKKIELLKELKGKQEQLATLNGNAVETYKDEYTDILKRLTPAQRKKYQPLIESGTEFKIEDFKGEKGEKLFNTLTNATSSYQKYQQAKTDHKTAKQDVKDTKKQIKDTDVLERSQKKQKELESQLDTVNEKLNDSTLSTEDRNDLLEQQYSLQKSINDELRTQAKYNKDDEAVAKLDAEDKNNEYKKNTEIYDNNKEDVLRNVNKNDNDITDIQNDIDLAGHGTVEQYNKIITLQKASIGEWEKQKQVAYDMREANKDNAALYKLWDDELQNCEDNIYQINSGIKETQQAILNLPLQEVEEKLQSINKEIDSHNRELDEQAELINAAIAVFDEEIELQNVIKEGIQDKIDALQEEHDLREANLNVQKAQYELEKAKNNRVTKVFREGQGFVFEADQDAVQEAQLNYDNSVYERKKQLLNEEIKKVDKQIDSLTKQKKQWEDITVLSERTALFTKAMAYDTEFRNKVLNSDVGLLTTIKDKYGEIYAQIDSLEESKKPYELLQEELTDISQQHSLSAIKYEEALARTMSALQQYYPELAKKYEQEGTSLEEVAKKQLESVGVTEESSEDNLETVKGTNEEITQSYNTMLTDLTNVFEQLNSLLTTFASNATATSLSVASSVASITSAISMANSVAGGNIDIVNDDKTPVNYEKIDDSFLVKYQDIADKINTSLIQNIKPVTTTSVAVPNTTNNKTTSFSFGDINVSGVQNTTDFAKAIVSSLSNAMKQELYK